MELKELCDIMVDTIQEALNPFNLVAFLFGFGILRHPLDYPRVRLSILYILSVWSIYAYVFYYVLFFLWSYVTHFTQYFIIIINLLITMIHIIITIREHKKFNVLVNKLSQVDNTLEKLGTPKEYRRMRNSIKWIIIMWFTIICIAWIIDSLCVMEMYNTKTIVNPIVLNYSFYINILINIMFMFLLRHLHSQLCRIALDINGLFEMQMTLQTMSCFVILTTMFYYQYHIMLCLMYNGHVVHWNVLLCTNIWFAFDLIRLILLNYICESISAKAQKTEGIIQKLTNLICFAKAREEIYQFVLQISLRPLKFSGMGLFYFGHKFLCKFFVWVFSVVIIVIQMDTSPIYQIVPSKNNRTCYMF